MKNFTLFKLSVSICLLLSFSGNSQIVTSSLDNGANGTLRTEIAQAIPGTIITFLPGITNITLTGGMITIDKSITITGNGLLTTVINGGASSRIFNITSGTVILNDVELTNGAADNGGGIQITNADLSLNAVRISSCVANGTSGSGGAIYVGTNATLTALNSTITTNRANRAGGGIETVAGTTITLTNVDLLSNNAGLPPATAAPGNGGALHISGAGTATIVGGLVNMNNAAAEGGGLWNGSGTMNITGTIISNNSAAGAAADNGGGGIYNLNNGTLNLLNATITGNSATGASGSGGGILNDVGAVLSIMNSSITENTANRAGGGIEDNSGPTSTVALTNVALNGNTVFTSPGNGGGLHVSGQGIITITDGTVNMNQAGAEGGGLWNGTGTMTINGTTIDGNTASGAAADQGGGGIYNLNGGSLLITAAVITDNVANGALGSGGGILNDVGSSLTISNSTISGNSANRAGGGIEDNSGVAGVFTLTNVNLDNNIVFNSPGNGGGLHVTGAGNITINGGTVNSNEAGAEGGGLWNGSGTMTIDGTTISENTASGAGPDQGGGGIYNLNAGTLVISNATISNNSADGTAGSGGGILNDMGSQLSITDSAITGNSAIRAGGGIEDNSNTSTIILNNVMLNNNTVSGPPGNGAGLHITGAGNVTITGGTVNNNIASLEGGGLWNGLGIMTISGTTISGNTAQGAAADDGGAGIFNNGGTLSITDVTIANNLATGTSGSGGGLLSIAGAITITESQFDNNSANRAGGAIEIINGTLTIMDSDLTNNDVDGGAGVANPGNGGALHISGVTMATITGGTVNGNMAKREGGGLWNQTGSTLTVTNVTIDSNTAQGSDVLHGGGGIFNNGGNLNVMNSTVSNNSTTGATSNGGGIHVKTGVANIMLSTISGNITVNNGGGIYNNATATINAATIAENTAQNGGGIANNSITPISLKNTIIAQNGAMSGDNVFSSNGILTSNGYNFVGNDATNAFPAGTTDIEGGNIFLGPLANNGGTTMTHALLPGSLAYNAGSPTDLFNDQIGSPVFGGIRDIGAFEAQSQLGTNDFASGLKSVVYPNPSNGTFAVSLNSNFGQNVSGKVIELASGKVIKSFSASESITTISLNNFSSGIYILQMVSDSNTETHKLIINK